MSYSCSYLRFHGHTFFADLSNTPWYLRWSAASRPNANPISFAFEVPEDSFFGSRTYPKDPKGLFGLHMSEHAASVPQELNHRLARPSVISTPNQPEH